MDGVLGIEEVLFFVPNVQEAKHWYGDLLGVGPYFDDEGYCAFHLTNATVGLHPSDEKNGTVSWPTVGDGLRIPGMHGQGKLRET
jgi:catechol 2,3-dioxygenase-like lactoylglutathione lyase family enzyme